MAPVSRVVLLRWISQIVVENPSDSDAFLTADPYRLADQMRTMDADWFRFQARLNRVVDGDTVDLLVDLGFRTRKRVRVRVKGIDTAEIYGVKKGSEEYRRGKEHSTFARAWFEENAGDEDWPFVLATEKDHGKYGRWPGRIISKSTGHVYNEDIVDEFPGVAS